MEGPLSTSSADGMRFDMAKTCIVIIMIHQLMPYVYVSTLVLSKRTHVNHEIIIASREGQGDTVQRDQIESIEYIFCIQKASEDGPI